MATIALLVLCAVYLPILVTGQCTPNKCRNGGICEVGYKGEGFRCKCPNSDALTYGLLCEFLSIGFHSPEAEVDRIIRSRTIPMLNFLKFQNMVIISFDFIGRCYQTKTYCHLFSMTTSDNKPLFTVRMHKSDNNQTKYTWIIEFTSPTNVTLGPLTGRINTDKWMRMKIDVRDRYISARIFSLYPRESDRQIKVHYNISGSADIEAIYNNSILLLGGFHGCVRHVFTNGREVNFDNFLLNDMNVGALTINDTDYNKYASNFCYPTEESCHSTSSKPGQRRFDSNNTTKCGANSQCEGSLGSGMDCSCRCDVGKRRQLDTLNNKDKCWQNLTKQDECIDDTTTLSTGHSDYELKWGEFNCHSLSMHAFRIEFMMLTSQKNVESLLELKDVFTVKIKEGKLKIVINGYPKEYNFTKTNVSDDTWHMISIHKLPQQLDLTVDIVKAPIYLEDDVKSPRICEAEIRLPNSCIRGFRISDVAMPVRETDQVFDYSGKPIQFHKGSSVSVGDHCDFVKTRLTPPTCNPTCQDNEECDGAIFGVPQCFCKNTFVRKQGICVATNINSGTNLTKIFNSGTNLTKIFNSGTNLNKIFNSGTNLNKIFNSGTNLTKPKSDRTSGYNPDLSLRNDSNDRNGMLKDNWIGMISAVVAFAVCQLLV